MYLASLRLTLNSHYVLRSRSVYRGIFPVSLLLFYSLRQSLVVKRLRTKCFRTSLSRYSIIIHIQSLRVDYRWQEEILTPCFLIPFCFSAYHQSSINKWQSISSVFAMGKNKLFHTAILLYTSIFTSF